MVKIKPRPGYCLVKLDKMLPEQLGSIVIPFRIRGKPGYTGVVETHVNRHQLDQNLKGCRVLLEQGAGRLLEQDSGTCIINEDNVLAIVEQQAEVKTANEHAALQRCRWCKSKGELNILVDNEGFCVTCGRNLSGEKRPASKEVSDDGFDEFQNVMARGKKEPGLPLLWSQYQNDEDEEY